MTEATRSAVRYSHALIGLVTIVALACVPPSPGTRLLEACPSGEGREPLGHERVPLAMLQGSHVLYLALDSGASQEVTLKESLELRALDNGELTGSSSLDGKVFEGLEFVIAPRDAGGVFSSGVIRAYDISLGRLFETGGVLLRVEGLSPAGFWGSWRVVWSDGRQTKIAKGVFCAERVIRDPS